RQPRSPLQVRTPSRDAGHMHPRPASRALGSPRVVPTTSPVPCVESSRDRLRRHFAARAPIKSAMPMSTPLAIPGDARRPAALPWPSARTTSIPPTCHYAGAQGEQALAAYLEASSLQSSVSSEIYRLAMELAVEVKVLADAEYDRRHPGTCGITTGPSQARKVFMPVRSLVEPANTTLERELLHACIELDASPCKVLYQTTVDTSRNSIARQDAVEQLVMGIGGTPAQGRAWLQGLEGIPQHVLDGTGDRMLGSAIDRLVCRQKS